jgi:predicted transcriptional regulator of viral defense system
MDYEQKIIDLMNACGHVITSNDVRKANIPTVYLSRMVRKGLIFRVDRGIYILQDGDIDEYYFFQKRNKVAIFSYISALYLHEFTDFLPNFIEVTVYNSYNTRNLGDNVRKHYVNKSTYNLGIIEKKTIFGNTVKVYDLERTICDLIKHRNKINTEIFVDAVNRYAHYKNKNLRKLYEYAKTMKILDKVSDIFLLIL